MQDYTLEPARHLDYRDFFKVRYESLKAKNAKFSLQAFARKSGLSKASIQFLLKKQRHLSLDKMPDLAKSLKMTEEESYFVYLMICKDSSKNPKIKAHFEAILSRIRNQYLPHKGREISKEDPENQGLHGDALFLVLHSACRLDGFREDEEWFRENMMLPRVDWQSIQAALAEMEKSGWLVRDDSGRLKPHGHFVFRPDPYDPRGMSLYTKTSSILADLMKSPTLYKPSIYMQLMLSMDEENLKKAELLMIDVHQRLSEMAKVSETPTASVYFGNYMLTLARVKTRGQGGS